jgi:hypothetical protein
VTFGDRRYYREPLAGSIEGIASNILADRSSVPVDDRVTKRVECCCVGADGDGLPGADLTGDHSDGASVMHQRRRRRFTSRRLPLWRSNCAGSGARLGEAFLARELDSRHLAAEASGFEVLHLVVVALSGEPFDRCHRGRQHLAIRSASTDRTIERARSAKACGPASVAAASDDEDAEDGGYQFVVGGRVGEEGPLVDRSGEDVHGGSDGDGEMVTAVGESGGNGRPPWFDDS